MGIITWSATTTDLSLWRIQKLLRWNRWSTLWSIIVLSLAVFAAGQEHSTCGTWDELVEGKNVRCAPVVRVSDGFPSDPRDL